MKKNQLFSRFALPIALVLASTAPLWAEGAPTTTEVQKNADFVWTLIAAFLVFFMQAGFACVESGFTRAKNCVNILMKNVFDFSFGSLAFWAIGFGLMFGSSVGGFIGTSGFFLADFAVDKDPWVYAFWLFQ
ncbi:MAG: ammonium transporter, partial [bacterium]